MTKLEQCRAELEAATKEAREALNKGTEAAEYEKIRNKLLDKRAQLDRELEVRAAEDALQKLPAAQIPETRTNWAGVRDQMRTIVESRQGGVIKLGYNEIRAITANGAGVGTAPGLVQALVDGGKLRSKVSVFTGPNSQTVVPVFSPHMAIPAGSAPGGTGGSADSTAVLTGDALTLKAWLSILQASTGALLSSDIESALPGIFQKAFGAAIDKAIIQGAGSGSDMLGVFIASAVGVPTGSDITATGSGAAPTWGDYAGMVLTLLALDGDPSSLAVVVHPTVLATALGSTAVGDQPMKQEFLTSKTILGAPVVPSTHALTTLTAGSYVAVGGYFEHYALAVAQELRIDPIKVVGSDNTYFQATMYMQGKPLVGSSFRRLKTGS